MLSWKDLSELAGSTSRVYTLLSTLHDLSVSSYASMPRPLDLPADAPFYDLGTLNGKLVDSAPPEQGVISTRCRSLLRPPELPAAAKS
jgi:ATP-binding cassette subfamily D (ALD) long-chain fatty acid import protein